MAFGALGAAAVSALGGLASSRGQSSANAMNNKMALRQMYYQAYMSSHAHRIEVADLRRAGLNPILSGTGGQGASTPSGASAHYENDAAPGVTAAFDALSKVSSALLAQNQAQLTKATTDNTVARTATEREQPELVRRQQELTYQNAVSARASQANIIADTNLKTIGAKVQLSEIDKNRELVKLFKSQGLSQIEQAHLYSLNAAQAVEVLKGLRNDGAINESAYGQSLRYIDRGLETLNKVPFLERFAPKSRR